NLSQKRAATPRHSRPLPLLSATLHFRTEQLLPGTAVNRVTPRSTANVVQVDSFVTTARQPFSNWRTPVFPSPRRLACALIAVLTVTAPGARLRAESTPAWLDQYRDPAARLIGAAISDTVAWRRLAVLTDSI